MGAYTSTHLGLVGPDGADPIRNGDNRIRALIDQLDGLSPQLGVNGVTKRRGSCIIPTPETRNNTAYGLLTTPDQVQNIEVPAVGYLEIDYFAQVDGTTNDYRAAVFIGANQLKVAMTGVVAPVTQAGAPDQSSFGGNNHAFVATPAGLVGTFADGDQTIVTTGQAVAFVDTSAQVTMELGGSLVTLVGSVAGGTLKVFLDAGTYDVSVQYKAATGTVTARERRLYVEAKGY